MLIGKVYQQSHYGGIVHSAKDGAHEDPHDGTHLVTTFPRSMEDQVRKPLTFSLGTKACTYRRSEYRTAAFIGDAQNSVCRPG
jgi:hypothetical protein